MNDRGDASPSTIARRRILIGCVIICTIGVVSNVALMAAGHSSRWTVILFCIEASGLVSGIASLRSMRGQR